MTDSGFILNQGFAIEGTVIHGETNAKPLTVRSKGAWALKAAKWVELKGGDTQVRAVEASLTGEKAVRVAAGWNVPLTVHPGGAPLLVEVDTRN